MPVRIFTRRSPVAVRAFSWMFWEMVVGLTIFYVRKQMILIKLNFLLTNTVK